MTIGDLKKKIESIDDSAPVSIGITDNAGGTVWVSDITAAELTAGTFYISVNTAFVLK